VSLKCNNIHTDNSLLDVHPYTHSGHTTFHHAPPRYRTQLGNDFCLTCCHFLKKYFLTYRQCSLSCTLQSEGTATISPLSQKSLQEKSTKLMINTAVILGLVLSLCECPSSNLLVSAVASLLSFLMVNECGIAGFVQP